MPKSNLRKENVSRAGRAKIERWALKRAAKLASASVLAVARLQTRTDYHEELRVRFWLGGAL